MKLKQKSLSENEITVLGKILFRDLGANRGKNGVKIRLFKSYAKLRPRTFLMFYIDTVP